ncbi:MAG: hypothetical protein JWN32_4176 [Solirubrobacterales bacterium]|nr:hypothetical protein [Solirubrobacterales bacterium]
MPRGLSPSRRLATAARWPVGLGLTAWRYMWRTTPLHRRERPGATPDDAPRPLPPGVERAEVQWAEDGTGPLFRRRYRVRIRDARLGSEELMSRVGGDPNRVSPRALAHFAKVRGERGTMRVGDEFVVRMPGPWDGPVRVVEVTPRSFRLATLEGHLEAGQIEFRAREEDLVVFEIESWARSASRLSNLLYHRLRMSKEIQLHIWTSFLERVVDLAGGRRTGGVDIDTRRAEDERTRPLGHPLARRALDELHDQRLNFDFADPAEVTPERGWQIDDYRQALPPETPGPPVDGRSWEIARRLMRDYEFADPDIVRAVFRADGPLEHRDMLLEVRFHGLRFHWGVRVGGVRDEEIEAKGRRARVWGWSYRTLQGHLEMGQMDFEVWKWLDSGEVEFRIHAFSHPARIANPIIRLGVRLFGRREQVRFARHACRRMAQLTAAELADGPGAGAVPRLASSTAVRVA